MARTCEHYNGRLTSTLCYIRLIPFFNNVAAPEAPRSRVIFNLLRDLHIMTDVEVTRDKNLLPEAAKGERMALLQKLPALAANGL